MIKRIIIVIAVIMVVVLGRGVFFYSGFYHPPTTELPSYEHIAVPPAPLAEFADNVSDNISGSILIDLAHENNFDPEELNVLMLRLISRGLTIKFFDAEDDLEKELLGEKEEEKVEEKSLEEEPTGEEKEVEADQKEEPVGEETEEETAQEEEPLSEEEVDLEKEEKKEPPPNAFIIVSPQKEFSDEEKETIDEFVQSGGKLLLIADPTRQDNMNDISLEFGLIFEPDYLYNLRENDINYRNIFITEFKENEITKNLEKIALYVTGSISSADEGIAFVDQNTFSSLIESRKQLSPIALTEENKVLGIYDLTFMTEPYNGTLDNNQLIANIADWLAKPSEEAEEVESTGKD